MSSTVGPPSPPVVAPHLLYFGMAGAFSAGPLAALLAAGLPVVGVVLPGPPGGPPLARRPPPVALGRALPLLGMSAPTSIADLAWARGLPVLAAGRLGHPATLSGLAALRPDLICVACFPRRLPPALLALAPLGGLNVHPSLLPAGRGPDPRFWSFRRGLDRAGVTVHRMTDTFDAGPIIGQREFPVPEGMTGAAFDERAATLGGALLVEAARALAAGTARPRPQDPAVATYDPWPTDADYLVTPDRPARWAFNFIRGVAGDGGPLAVLVDGRRLPVADALGYTLDGDLSATARRDGDALWLQCAPGLLHVRLARSSAAAPPG